MKSIRKPFVLVAVLAMLSTLPLANAMAELFNIPAQSATSALNAYAQQSNLSIVYSYDDLASYKTNAVSGNYEPEKALQLLLKDTGLVIAQEGGTIAVRPGDKQSDAAGASMNAVDGSAKTNTAMIEEIVVTAEKRSESLQSIPIAISAITADTMERVGIAEVNDLKMLVPSLQFGNGSHPHISLRGVGQQTENIGAESGVTISENGMPLANNFMFNPEFLDIERVEVLRGPQGTINGRNATGGAINIYSNLPTEDLEGRIKVGMGNYNRFFSEGVVSGPLGESGVLGRLALRTDQADGWLDNTLLNEKVLETEEVQARVSLLSRLNEDVEVLLTVETMIDKGDPEDSIPVELGRLRADTPTASEGQGFVPNNWEDLEFQSDQLMRSEVKSYKGVLKLTWDISPTATLTSTTGYARYDFDVSNMDSDGSGADLQFFPFVDGRMRQTSQELTLASDISDKLDMILGGLYLHATAEEPIDIALPGFAIPSGSLIFLPDQEIDSYAIYTQWRYQLTDDLRIALGARYTYDEKNYVEDRLYGPAVGGPATASLRGSDSWGAFTPRVAVDYTPTDDLTLYASASRGYKAGGFSTYGSDPANPTTPDVYDPEFVWSYELGAKAYWLDRSLRTAVAAFYLDYTDFQAGKYINQNGVLRLSTENASAATVQGVELELEAQITEALKLSATGSWLDATFDELQSGDIAFPELNDPITGVRDLSGNRIPQSPEWQFAVSGEYTASLGGNYLGVLRADYQWQDKQYYDIYNNEVLKQDSYGVLNLHMALETEDGRWQFTVFANNVLDERYLTYMSALNSWSSYRGYPGRPRTYGLSFNYNF